MKDRFNEGEGLVHLGLLNARQGRHDEAARCLNASEALMRAGRLLHGG